MACLALARTSWDRDGVALAVVRVAEAVLCAPALVLLCQERCVHCFS
eukprot:COSAG04_NODE_17605_length_464_cov_0.898630_1_plen_46_part_10